MSLETPCLNWTASSLESSALKQNHVRTATTSPWNLSKIYARCSRCKTRPSERYINVYHRYFRSQDCIEQPSDGIVLCLGPPNRITPSLVFNFRPRYSRPFLELHTSSLLSSLLHHTCWQLIPVIPYPCGQNRKYASWRKALDPATKTLLSDCSSASVVAGEACGFGIKVMWERTACI